MAKRRELLIVVAHAGSYEEYRSWTVAVYSDVNLANEHANAASAWARRWYEKHRNDSDNWERDEDYVMPEPHSPFDDCLERHQADDVTYGWRSVPFHEAVPSGTRLTCRRVASPAAESLGMPLPEPPK